MARPDPIDPEEATVAEPDRSLETARPRLPRADAPPRSAPPIDGHLLDDARLDDARWRDARLRPAPPPPTTATIARATPSRWWTRQRLVLTALGAVTATFLSGAVVAELEGAPRRQPTANSAPGTAARIAAGSTTAATADSETGGPATAPPPVVPRPRVALRSAAGWTGTATYSLRAGTESSTVTLTRDASSSRLDVATAAGTSSLIGTPGSWVACQTTDRSSCLLVAGAGAELPDAYDPGLARLVLIALPTLADADGLTDLGWLPDSVVTQAAACVGTSDVDPAAFPVELTGVYCVTERGLLRQATTPSGLLSLAGVSADVDAAAFTPPATPVPLA